MRRTIKNYKNNLIIIFLSFSVFSKDKSKYYHIIGKKMYLDLLMTREGGRMGEVLLEAQRGRKPSRGSSGWVEGG
jgi:hypothetical protein